MVGATAEDITMAKLLDKDIKTREVIELKGVHLSITYLGVVLFTKSSDYSDGRQCQPSR